MNQKPSLVLLTGASGFIGRAMLAHLQATRVPVRTTSRNAMPEPGHVVADLQPETQWAKALEGVDCVLHLAGLAHQTDQAAQASKKSFFQVNTEGTLCLARQAAQAGVKRFIFISTIGVNGEETTGRPFIESDLPAPNTPYAQSKLAAEYGLWELAKKSSMEIVVVRPPLVYGVGAPGNLGKLARAIELHLPLPLAGVKKNKRSFVAINNLVGFISLCMSHPAAANQLFLISDDEGISTADLIKKMAEATGNKPVLFYFSPLILKYAAHISGLNGLARRLLGDLQIDNSKARRMLCWSPQNQGKDQPQ